MTRYRFTGHLAHLPRTVVFSRAVNLATITYPRLTITFDNPYSGVGSTSDIEVGMTVLVYAGNTNTLKGILRVAYGGASSTVLQVNEFSKGTLDLRDNDRFDVVREFDIWDQLVSNTAAFNKDSRRVHVDESSNPPPIANSGGDVVGHVDKTTNLLTANFYGSYSERVDPDSGALSHSWAFGAGATPTSSSAEDPTGVTFPVGERLIKHTVTDSNGQSENQFVFVGAYNRTTHRPLSVQMREIRFSIQTGYYTATFALPKAQQAALSAFPKRAYIVYWEDEEYDGVAGSFGAAVPGREHIKFAGYCDLTSIDISAEGDEITFDAIAPLGVLEKTGALPQLVVRGTGNWQRLKGLTFWRWLWYLVFWGSTFKLRHDLIWPDGQEYAYSRLAVEDTSSIKGQLDDGANSIRVQTLGDVLGRLVFVRDPDYLSAAERAARAVALDFTTANTVKVSFQEEHRPQYKLVVFEAITAGASTDDQDAVYSLAPGKAPGPGTQVDTMTRQVVIDQPMANQAAADRLAQLNSTYYDETTKDIRAVPRGVTLETTDDAHVIDPALRLPVTLALPASTNTRGISFADTERFTVEAMSISYDADTGGKDISYTVDHETHGAFDAADATDTRPTPDQNGLPPSPGIGGIPGLGTWTPPVTGGWFPVGTQNVGGVNEDGYLYYCGPTLTGRGFDVPAASSGPYWLRVLLSALSGHPTDMVQISTLPTRIVVTTDDSNGVWLIDSVGPTPSITLAASMNAAVSGTGRWRIVEAPIGTDHVVIISHYDSDGTYPGTWKTESFDKGATWSDEVQISPYYESGTVTAPGGLHVSTNVSGTALTSAYSQTGNSAGAEGKIYRLSSNYATITQITTPTGYSPKDTLAFCVHVPLHDNPTDELVYFGAVDFSLPINDRNYFLRKNKDDSVSDITPTINSRRMRPFFNRSIHTCHQNRQYLATVVTGGGDTSALIVSRDGGNTFAQVTPGTLTDYTFVEVAGNNPLALYVAGLNGAVGFSNDFGATGIDDRRGNIPADYPSVGRFLRLFGL